MDPQSQFSLSHIFGQAVDVTSYNTLQHQLHGYGNTITTISNITNIGSSSVTPPGHSVSIQDMVPAGQVGGGTGMVTMGYAHHAQPAAPIQSYHAVFNNMGVTHVNPQVQTSQVQYFSYDSSAVSVRAPPLHTSHHPQVAAQTPSIQGQRYSSCPMPVHVVTSNVPVSSKLAESKIRTSNISSKRLKESENMKKKKIRKDGVSAKITRKTRRNRGESYISAAGKLVDAKKYVDKDCKCKNKCFAKLGSVADRENVFRTFWEIGDFGKQNAYLTENVMLTPTVKKRHSQPLEEKNTKTVTRLYYVRLHSSSKQIRICKTMFLWLHGVSNGRLDRVLKAVKGQTPDALKDKRGHHTPSNKTSQEAYNLVTQHIWSVRSRSEHGESSPAHSQLGGSSQVYTFSDLGEMPGKDLSVKKMYEMYKRWCEEKGKTPVSLWVYRHIEKSWNCKENATVKISSTSECPDAPPPMSLNITGQHDGFNQTRELVHELETQEILEHHKRKRNRESTNNMTRLERKVKRNSGAAYYTAAGKLKEGKHYADKNCGCKYRCIPEIGTEECRRQVFLNFWNIGDFTKQNEYIAQKVVLVPVIQRESDKAAEKFSRMYTRIYNVQMKPGEEPVRVCKTAFLHLHGVSNGRMDRVLRAVACKSPFAFKDRRGNHSPKNKTKPEDIEYICHHIGSFPAQVQNYDMNSKLSLPQDLSVEKMYRMYKQQCRQDNRTPVSSFVYRRILKERFNCFIKSTNNKTPEEDFQFVCHHVEATTRILTEAETSIAPEEAERRNVLQEGRVRKIHNDYVLQCEEEGRKPVGIDVYRKIFKSKFQPQNSARTS